ncbi:GPW/gp25 family protein [Enterobacteriaceae bacterium C34A]
MTTRYIGMNRTTGRTITDADHISQSMSDILRTPVGSRVMRRDYGSLLSSLIDMPQNDALNLQLMCACYMALLKWEPRVTITSLTLERRFNGQMVVDLTGVIKGSGDPLSLTIPVS